MVDVEEVPAMDGVAKIKAQYLDHHHVRLLDLEYVSDRDKSTVNSENIGNEDDDVKSEPDRLTCRKKLKGQNKNRRKTARLPVSKRLCPNVCRSQSCLYPDTCSFMHDVKEFIKNKPIDISGRCHLFETFGWCEYGAACRFSSSHLSEDLKNMRNEELCAYYRGKMRTRNALSKELQQLLRKRQYNFKAANLVTESMVKFYQLKKSQSRPAVEETSDEARDLHWCRDIKCFLSHNQSDADRSLDTDEKSSMLKSSEKKKVDFCGKLYLSPLTTVGNLPFRRICKQWGADITCGEMVMAQNLLQGSQSEWALLKRHESEDLFGVQICGAHADQMTRCAQLICDNIDVDFVDINAGCPIDLVYAKGAGCALMNRLNKLDEIICGMRTMLTVPLTVKIRTGCSENKPTAHILVPTLVSSGVDVISMHGRSREQRFTKSADWSYIDKCAKLASPTPFFGCGDILSYVEANSRLAETAVSGVMIARGALIKPWIFKEIKEQRYIDISSKERFDMLKNYVNFGLEHWGSDAEGVEKTRRFILEWLSFLCRYIPVGLLEQLPPKINQRPPYYRGRDDLETLMASRFCADWIKISEMLLGPVPSGFSFLPKHKANSFS